MAKIIKHVFIMFDTCLRHPPEMFCICGGRRRYVPPEFSYPSTRDAWETDMNHMSHDFKLAADRLCAEVAQ